MKEMVAYSSPEEEEEEEEEEKGKGMLRKLQLARCRRSESSSTTHDPNDLATIASDRSKRCTSLKRVLSGDTKAKSCAIERANEVQANLDPRFPSFVKSMRASHVSGFPFQLGLPVRFCEAHLPKENVMINLIDENQEGYAVKFCVANLGFGNGWRVFSIAHKLVVGDTLVFQLTKSTEFQVYIIRAYGPSEINGVVPFQSFDARGKQIESCKRTKMNSKPVGRPRKTVPLAIPQQPGEKSRSDKEEVGSEVLEGSRILETGVEFNNIKNLENFTIAVNGLIIDSEISEQARSKYYELCCSQKAFLHDNLLKAINSKLAAGLISQVIDIADAIRASNLSTSRDEFTAWDKSLGAFEGLGMNVGFLRARTKKLMSILESDEGIDSKRYREAVAGSNRVKEVLKTLKEKLVKLEEASERLEAEIENLEVRAEHHELKFRTEADAPW